MTDQKTPTTQPANDTAQGGGEDWKAKYEQAIAESRKWESRSKANAEKAAKYDELQAQSKSVEERLTAIEAENKALKDREARNALVAQVAQATGVSETIIASLSATDEESLTAQAKAIAEAYKTPGGAPKVSEGGQMPNNPAQPETTEQAEKRQFVRDLFGAANNR